MKAYQRAININKVNVVTKIQQEIALQHLSFLSFSSHGVTFPLTYYSFFILFFLFVFLHFVDSYIIKLFDRSVDLAQFNTSTPLYPICRAWMRNNPSVREPPASPSPSHSMVEEEVRPYSKYPKRYTPKIQKLILYGLNPGYEL